MMRRIVSLVVAAALALAFAPSAVRAQSDSGEIKIIVTDASTKQPIGLARILLDGAVITSELTGKNGEVDFTDVPDGIYRARIVKSGYQSLTSASFEVLDGRVVTVTFNLIEATGGLKVIGRVTVKASATISTSSITQDSAQRRLSDDLAGALNKLSGVTVSTSSDDSNATQTVSLEGHDASQTQLTLDGIPLNAPGTAGDLRGFATDLFGGATVRMGPTVGGLGGSVNFSTLQPTLSWLSQGSLSTGSYGRYNYSFAESGSVGKLGIAAETVYRTTPSLVDGMSYLDASGLDYVHEGDSDISGNLFKLRYEFGDSQSITGTFMNSARDTDIVCLRAYSPPALPCGYGPNNTDDLSFQLYSLTDNALIGATQVQASIYSMTGSNLLDELNRYVDVETQPPFADEPFPAPIGYSTLTKTQGFMINTTLPAKERHTISIMAYGVKSSQLTTPLVPQAAQYYFGSQPSNYSAIQATDTIHSSDKLSLAGSVGVSNAGGLGGASALASVGATWNPTRVDSYTASYALGGVAASQGRSQILTDPASLRFDCNGDVAYGNAPGDQPGKSSSTSIRAGYTRTLRGGNISLTLYRQVQNGALLPTYVNGTVLASQLPPGYLQEVEELYSSPAGCNAPAGTPFGPQQLYFQTPINGVQRIYQGAEAGGYLTLGRLVVEPYYNITEARINSSSYLFENPYSITIPGGQLPNVPLQKAGITFDYKAPNSIFEWLADAQYVAKNNPNNLPSYTTFDAGVTAQLTTGTLTFAAQNITNTFAGIFSGPENATPYVTVGGYTVGTTARPLTPRLYSVTYSVKFGPGAVNSQTATAFRAPRGNSTYGPGGAGGPAGGPGGPSGGGGPQGGGRGGFGRLFTPLPNTPPIDPFALTDNPQLCSAANAAQARQFASAMKAFIAQIEEAKTSAGYPATMTSPALDAATVTYHGLGSTYALAITPHTGMIRAFVGCMPIHIARPDDVSQRKLYTNASTLFFVPQLNFMPAVGLYVVPRAQQAGQEQFRLYRLPTTAPSDPFQVRAVGGSCTTEARNIANQALTELRNYFATAAKAPSWTIASHVAKSGTWYELTAGDPTVIPALLMCGRVATATADELSQRGFDAKPVPALNYAKPLGLYLLRRQPPNGGGASPAPSPSP